MDERSGGYPTPADHDIADSVVHYLATRDEWSFWAYGYLSDLAEADPLRALTIIRLVLGEVHENRQIEWFGAAQVEETVYFVGARLANGDPAPFEQLKALAHVNERFRHALAYADPDIDGNDPPELWAGIDEILGTTYAERRPGRQQR